MAVRQFFVAALTAAVFAAFSCPADAQSNAQRDAVVGGVAGAIIGGIVGKQNDETPEGIAIGGVAGAIAGGLLGKNKDRQVQEQYYYQQQAQAQQVYAQQRAVSIADAVSMSQSGVGDQVVISQIRSNGVSQEIGVNEIIALHQNGVSETVINAMQQSAQGGIAAATPQRQAVTVVERAVPVPVHVPGPVIVERYSYGRPHYGHRSYPGPQRGGPRYGNNVNFHYRSR